MEAEKKNHRKNGTFDEIEERDVLKGKRPLTSRWVFNRRFNSTRHIIKFKARLVARGFTQ